MEKGKVAQVYQKFTQIEHVLERSDMYGVSKEPETDTLYVPILNESGKMRMERKEITYIPGFYKIFDEILVNAADNKIRDPTTDTIKVNIDRENNQISIWNNGKGIPVEMHQTENIYIPQLIFGNLLTSSNFDDSEKRMTGGRNGLGAKLTNIYSKEFTLETHDSKSGLTYKQTWKQNMRTCLPYKITKSTKKKDYTKVTFTPDLDNLNMTKITSDTELLLKKRVYDLTGSLRGIKVYLDNERIPISSFKDYISMYLELQDGKGSDNNAKIVYDRPNERWEVAVTVAESGSFQHVSFVNNISTTKGGTHVAYVADKIIMEFIDLIRKKEKTATVKPAQVKNQLFIFINCLIENPTFDSQTKENMTLRPSHFGSTCSISDGFMKRIANLGMVEKTIAMIREKEGLQLKKTDGQKRSRLSGIAKLNDANEAGGRKSKLCTLFIVEGDSALTFAVTGIPVVPQGRDHYGAFPLRGKLLNVRDASMKQKLENSEITHLKQILGLQEGKEYSSVDSLRYGHLCILVDSDLDGTHIKGLILNWLETSFPSLLRLPGFLLDFRSPIVRCSKRNDVKLFYTLNEYEEWKKKYENDKGWEIKYFKGLGTSKASDIKSYFGKIKNHLKRFRELTEDDSEKLDMVFSKKRALDRKTWLKSYSKHDQRESRLDDIVSIQDFIDKDLIEFSMYDNIRSIPCVVDGLKPGQRKILFTAFKTNMEKDIKVAQFSAEVSKMTEYCHGEQSLCETIIGMAQDYVGSNNIALFSPEGAFGTRLQGGKDAASPRYIYTKLANITRTLFPRSDDAILDYLNEDGFVIEPKYYVPILPMVLVNGAEGIGSGYSTTVLNYNPHEIAKALLRRTEYPIHTSAHAYPDIRPWYKGFLGTSCEVAPGKWIFSGVAKKTSDTTIEVTELPIQTWTESYKEFLGKLILENVVKDYKEYHTDTTVHFVIKTTPEGMRILQTHKKSSDTDSNDEQAIFLKNLKLTTTKHATNMMLFSSAGFLQKYNHVNEILEEFYQTRMQHYEKRKIFLTERITAEISRCTERIRFISSILEGTLVLNNRKKADIVEDLDKAMFVRNENSFNHLINLPLHTLSKDKIESMKSELDAMEVQYGIITSQTAEQMYKSDLLCFLEYQSTK
ncbi:DNA topoisomerase 2 [Blyttiomyces helicus]|uniref:DNA topoisomerase 2 n=1 Tax=Blyttiomyces helicus TaxID=388810 RepID=A0A4P9W3E3_9FUNG|nr:DNA topoisomerase 2 [Blyttiomyces helicus]|eukprot:RKO86644.1 DNA topoisomerase 2 [Blyttiomyces helicus]